MPYFHQQPKDIYITVNPNDPEVFYAKIPYDGLSKVHRIGGKWMQSGKQWRFPLDDTIWEKFQAEFKEEFESGLVHKDMTFLIAFQKRRKDKDKFMRFKEIAMRDEPTDFGVDGLSLDGKNCLFNYQKWGVKCGLNVGDGFLIGDACGVGKCQPVDSLVFVPSGVKRIGDVKVGDQVIGSDGRPHAVVGVYPRGKKKIYRVTFSDGCHVDCGEEHLWTVIGCDGLSTTLSVGEMMDSSLEKERVGSPSRYRTCYRLDGGGWRWRIPIVKPVSFKCGGSLPLDPYRVGFELGKGGMGLDGDCDGYRPCLPFNAIEDAYKYSSVEDRLSLLQGLMDASGRCHGKTPGFGGAEFLSLSERLADDVTGLVQSLGGITVRSVRGRADDEPLVLKVLLPPSFSPFLLSDERLSYRPPAEHEIARWICGIEPVGEAEAVCIAVDAPDHLYVTEHFAVTHNTIQGIGIALEHINRGVSRNCLVVCPASLKYNWKEEIARFTGKDALVIGHKCKNSADREKQWIADGYEFKIVNYETVARDLYAEPKKADNRISCAKAVLNSFDTVIFDECFSYYSQVMLEDGSLAYIGDIVTKRLPVRVQSYNWDKGEFESRPVLNHFDNGRKETIRLVTTHGVVHVTRNHKYYRADGTPVMAGELRHGDVVAACAPSPFAHLVETEVLAVDLDDDLRDTYNIEVEANHNYVCGGSLVSNCHMLKHHSSQRTLACRQFNAKYRIGLTGTPLDGRLEEIHSIFQILKPGLFVSKRLFMERHAEYDYFGAVKGYRRIREVSDKIAPYYLRRLKSDVLKDLPEKLHKDLLVELSPKNMRAYRNLVKKKNEITTDASAMELIMRARQFLDFPEILGLHNTSDKYAVFKRLVDSLVKENGHKILVFSQYTNTLYWLKKNLEEEGYRDIMVIDGSVQPEDRQEICKKFNAVPRYKILLGTNAMSTGLNLQAAEDVINYTADFSPAIMKQREDRAYRCGVKHCVNVYDFVCMDTVDERVRDILSRKMKVNNALLNENVESFEIDGMTTRDILNCL